MQSVCVYYVDLLNDMKTTVKTFLISMLLILTCSISGKAVDFAKVCVKSAETCKVSATLSSCSATSSKKIKQESSKFADTDSHGQQMLSWALSLLLKFILPTSSVYAG